MFRVKTLFLIIVLFVTGCASEPETPIKAVYLVRAVGQLSPEDLQAHPEVEVTDNFDTLKEIAQTKVALWIDINAVDLVKLEWLGQGPQAYYPVVLVGYGDEACSFFNAIPYFSFEVPCCLECSAPPSGFSVNIQSDVSEGHMQGYEKTPTVRDILDITNPLLDGTK
jgi:hypothetical protein